MIDLTRTSVVLREAHELIGALHGKSLDETDAITSQSKGQARQEKARMSQDIRRLAELLQLASTLTTNEYWYARGERDPLNPQRSD